MRTVQALRYVRAVLLLLGGLAVAFGEVRAVDQLELEGIVTVEVDHSDAIWTVTITNLSDEALTYEMLDGLPRGLGVEIWEGEWGVHLYAGNLAKTAGVDGFPADLRELPATEEMSFPLDPKFMSSLDSRIITKWQKLVESGYFSCRVVFGIYASPEFNMTAADDDNVRAGKKKAELCALMDLSFWKEGVVGLRIRKELQRKGLSLVTFNYGRNGGKDHEYSAKLTVAATADFESNPQWDGSEKLPVPINELVSLARKSAEERSGECALEEFAISTCSDDSERRYLNAYFLPEGARNYDSISAKVLLNGAATRVIELPLTEEEYGQLKEYGIPDSEMTEGE